MDREEWVQEAVESTRLSERRAEALWRRQNGEKIQDAADAMGIKFSNLANAESEARQELIRSQNLLSLAAAIGAEPDERPAIGTCAECDEPSPTLGPHPADDGPIEGRRMVCPDCKDELAPEAGVG